MAAIIVGYYDASQFVEDDYSTYPHLPLDVHLYQPGMGWNVTVPGVVSGQYVDETDILFAIARPQLYGQFNFGSKLYGSKPIGGGDWLVDEVSFLAWDGNALPPDQVPYPNAGCPFTPDHGEGGAWGPGWRIVVDCYYNEHPGRRFGQYTYGDEVFGADQTSGRRFGTLNYGEGLFGSDRRQGPRWNDVTQPSFHVEVGDGMAEGGPRVAVSELVVTFLDPVGRWFDIATPGTFLQPQVGNAIRVGLLDPQYKYHPLITAEIERIEDVHDGEGVREVSVRGFGRIMDLVVDLPQVQRPQERASARFNYYARAAGWRWDDPGTVEFPADDALLIADVEPKDVLAREEMDRTCSATGWFLDSTRQGRMRVRSWPHEPVGPPLQVVDCYGYPDTLVSHSLVLASDESQLLNYAVTTNTADPPVSVVWEDASSVARFGRRGRTFGFPMTNLPWTLGPSALVWAQRAVARYAYITRQCESFDVDTAVDHGWLPALADLDAGRLVHIRRLGLMQPLQLDGVITGWRWRLDPGRWQGTVFVSTITKSY